MRSGTLKHKVIFQEPVKVNAGMGQKVDSYRDLCPAWVNIQPGKTKEVNGDKQTVPEKNFSFECRYIKGLKKGMRIKLSTGQNERFFIIESVINVDELNFSLLIEAREVLN